ncbi:uncharacterized protein LOC113557629 [Rhopalosiphum maidis]|uniref:uncharacterized protein LOC113557629 n=1 Tax=Rhopalosiphum maidis TaxID=43146 RepID=UPI000EFFFE3A|nr:uncharacterized protein LOC113557629 [Rhopalosiphum maidis]
MDENDVAKLYRSPPKNSETLPLWKTTTSQTIEWRPNQHSGLCVNSFEKTKFIVSNRKRALKSTKNPKDEYCTDFMEYNKKKSLNTCSDGGQKEKLIKNQPLNIEYQLLAVSYFKKIKALKMKKRRYTKQINLLYSELLKKKNLLIDEESHINSLDNDPKLFSIFVDTEMKKLKQNKKVYLTTKFKIKKILTKGLLKALKSEI